MYNTVFQICFNSSKAIFSQASFRSFHNAICSSVCSSNHYLSVKYQFWTIHEVRKCSSFHLKNKLKPLENVKKSIPTQEDLNKILEDPAMLNKYKLLELEIDYLKHDAQKVPDSLCPKEWIYLLSLQTRSQRQKYLRFLWLNEIKMLKSIDKRKKNKEMYINNLINLSEHCGSALEYGLGKNSFFLRIFEQTMDKHYNNRLKQAIMFEPKMVYDLGFAQQMTTIEINNCVKQLSLSIALNRRHPNPYDIYFCNLNPNTELCEKLVLQCPNLIRPTFPMHITAQSYLDIFDRDRLVYLTPHTNKIMDSYDPDLVYIIGGIVDKIRPLPLTQLKAKKEGIRTMKFPLDQYYTWNCGHKSLTLNQALMVLLDLKSSNGDWNVALKHVPQRKVRHQDSLDKPKDSLDTTY